MEAPGLSLLGEASENKFSIEVATSSHEALLPTNS